jgi:alanine racemase
MEVVRTILENGATCLAVSMLDEAIQLRKNNIDVPILILSYTDPIRAADIIKYNVTQAVFSHDLARALSEEAVRQRKNVKNHIKIDTGMTRVGFMRGTVLLKMCWKYVSCQESLWKVFLPILHQRMKRIKAIPICNLKGLWESAMSLTG